MRSPVRSPEKKTMPTNTPPLQTAEGGKISVDTPPPSKEVF